MSAFINVQTATKLTPHTDSLTFHDPAVALADMASKTTASGYTVTQKRGSISGVAVSVSGLGATAHMDGSFSFTMKRLESSKTYQSMVKKYSISGGVRGFFGWLGMGKTIYDAIMGNDYNLALVGLLLATAAVLLANLLADLAYGVVDPRVSYDR